MRTFSLALTCIAAITINIDEAVSQQPGAIPQDADNARAEMTAAEILQTCQEARLNVAQSTVTIAQVVPSISSAKVSVAQAARNVATVQSVMIQSSKLSDQVSVNLDRRNSVVASPSQAANNIFPAPELVKATQPKFGREADSLLDVMEPASLALEGIDCRSQSPKSMP